MAERVCGFSGGSMLPKCCNITAVGTCDALCWLHCSFSQGISTRQLSLITELKLSGSEMKRQFDKLENERIEHAVSVHNMPDNRTKKTHSGNGAFQGAFAFTLTKSPDDQYTEFDMVKAVRKVMSQKSCPVKRYAWYLEYGDSEKQTHPHIHGLYETETSGRIEAKHFKRAWPIWDEKTKLGRGHRGGYHRPVRSEEGYTDYIKKDAGKNEWFNIESSDQ